MKINKKLIEGALSLHKPLTNEVAKSTSAEQLKAALGDFLEPILDGVMKVRSVEELNALMNIQNPQRAPAAGSKRSKVPPMLPAWKLKELKATAQEKFEAKVASQTSNSMAVKSAKRKKSAEPAK